jgi:hypothetical protein
MGGTMITFEPISISSVLYGFAAGLLAIAAIMSIGRYRIRGEIEALQTELLSATDDQVGAMRTLTAFRRQYHDGTGALVKAVERLTREVKRLKTAVKETGIKGD